MPVDKPCKLVLKALASTEESPTAAPNKDTAPCKTKSFAIVLSKIPATPDPVDPLDDTEPPVAKPTKPPLL